MTHRLVRNGELLLYGTVGGDYRFDGDGIVTTGFTDEEVIAALSEMSGDITVRINSAGGFAFQGIAIFNALKAHEGNITIYIDALAASAASVIAMAGNEIIMRTGSMMMVHNPAGLAIGTSEDMRRAAESLDTLAAAAAEIYAEKTKLPIPDVLRIMEDETWMTGPIAVSMKFADRVETSDPAEPTMQSPAFDYKLFRKAPAQFLSMTGNRAGSVPGIQPVLLAPNSEIKMENPNIPAPAPAVNPSLAVKDDTKDIFGRCRAAKLTMDESEKVIMEAGGDINKARDLIISTLADRDPSSEIRTVAPAKVTADASERFQEGATKALMSRAGIAGGEVNEFTSLTLRDMARHTLDIRGDKTLYRDPLMMVAAAFRPTMVSGPHSTSDFVSILGAVANKSMLKGYDEAEETFQKWTSVGTLSDFKIDNRVDLGVFGNLDQVPEGAEYKYGTVGDRGEQIQLATYGKMFSITRQAIINDDLNAFTKIPMRMGRAAKRTIGSLVYAILTSNPNMSDGVALFHATHKNLMTAAALSATSLGLARAAMALQKDKDDRVAALNIRPAFLLVPIEIEPDANVLIASEFDPAKTQRVPNPVRGLCEVVSDARLSTASATAWYLAANPNQHDGIEVAYLNGIQSPTIEQRDGWNVDGVEFKVRIDAGVKALDHRTFTRNPGA